MRLAGVVFLIVGMLCNSALAAAEGPIPFDALEQAANSAVQHEATGNSTVATSLAQPRHITSGGKVMRDVGIGLLGVGLIMVAIGANTDKNQLAGGKIREVGLAAGGSCAGVGLGLILFGVHRRSPK